MLILATVIVEGLIYAAIGIGLSILLVPKNKAEIDTSKDERASLIADRGAYLPVIMGKYETGAVFAWVGNQELSSEVVGTVDNGFGGDLKGDSDDDVYEDVYREQGWHIICGHQVDELYQIESSGTIILRETISRETTPSGTVVDLGREGAFWIFWGEDNQPKCPPLVSNTGIDSSWPGVCYIFWDKRRVGSGQQWGQMKYTVGAYWPNNGLLNAGPHRIDTTTGPGINPAHMFFQLLTAGYGLGSSIPKDQIDSASLGVFGQLMHAEGISFNLLISGGTVCKTLLSDLMASVGVFLVPVDGRIFFQVVREDSNVVPLTEDMIVVPDIETENVLESSDVVSRVLFLYNNASLNFAQDDVPLDNDSAFSLRDRSNLSSVQLIGPTDKDTATKVALRREFEVFGNNQSVRFTVNRGAQLITPGRVVELPSGGRIRITSVKPSALSPAAEVEGVVDSFGNPPIVYSNDGIRTPPAALAAEPDIAVAFYEIPAEINPNTGIFVFRVPAHAAMTQATVHLSTNNGSTYKNIGSQDRPAVGGRLVTAIADTEDDTLIPNAEIEIIGGDVTELPNLTTDETAYYAGAFLVGIGPEMFFARRIETLSNPDWQPLTSYSVGDTVVATPLGVQTGLRFRVWSISGGGTTGTSAGAEPTWADTRDPFDPNFPGFFIIDGDIFWYALGQGYLLIDMLRARFGTNHEAHAVGDTVFMSAASRMTQLFTESVAPGSDICIKTLPRTPSESTTLNQSLQVCGLINGVAEGSPSYLNAAAGLMRTGSGEYMDISLDPAGLPTPGAKRINDLDYDEPLLDTEEGFVHVQDVAGNSYSLNVNRLPEGFEPPTIANMSTGTVTDDDVRDKLNEIITKLKDVFYIN